MADHEKMKLGKKPPRHDPHLRMLSAVTQDLPPPPDATDWTRVLPKDLGMMKNDDLGDCTCAAVGHAIQVMTANDNPPMVTIADDTVVDLYSKSCGYNPADPNSDQGGIETEVLRYWYHNPVGGQHRLNAFAGISPRNRNSVKDAIWLFGCAYIGLNMPKCFQKMDVWDVPLSSGDPDGVPGSWGGHAVIAVEYNPRGLTLVTWGELKKITWAGWDAYCDEAYALLCQLNWFGEDRRSPPGFNYGDAVNYLNALRA
jgi:hypothetical protein